MNKGVRVMWVQTGAYHLSSLYWLIALIVVFIIALIAIIVAGRAMAQARGMTGAGRPANPGQPGVPGTGPEDRKLPESFRMLDERYARGEISREEYLQRQADLQSKV
jgi:putative membrane protein